MFEDSLFFSGPRVSRHRGWTALVSVFVQALLVSTVIVLPLFVRNTLPIRALREIIAVPAAPPAREQNLVPQHRLQQIVASDRQVLAPPQSIPRTIAAEDNTPPAPALGDSGTHDRDELGGEDEMSSLLGSGRSAMPVLSKPSAKRYKVSGGVEQGLLVAQVKPVYPPLAREAGMQGEVVLQAVIGKDGRIKNLRVIRGSPLLAAAAVDAVQQWRYRPYLLNGEPVEVETQITANFKLS